MEVQWRGRLALGGGLVLPVAVAAALVPFRTRVDNTNVALVLVAVVVAVAATGGRASGLVTAVSAALSFDFFHTLPYQSFSIARRTDVETAVLLLIVGLIVGQLSSRSMRHRVDAHESSLDIARLHAVAELVAAGAPPDEVILAVRNELKYLLSLRGCNFSYAFDERPHPRLERGGEVVLAGMQWGTSEMGLPGKEVDLVVNGRGQPFGRFVLFPTPGQPVSWDRRALAVALADQVGAALAVSWVG